MASGVSHVLLVSGFFAFTYLDAGRAGADFGPHLFNTSNFWRLATIFDTAPMLALILLFSALYRADLNPPGLVAMTLAITYIIGTLQWFFVGGAVGALLERFFEGLRTPDPEDDWDNSE